jgi:REP element-mobilizing transposase RayT
VLNTTVRAGLPCNSLRRSTHLHALANPSVDENFNVHATIEFAALIVLIACNRIGRTVSDWYQDSAHGDVLECQILEGHLMPDHVHICIAIPPKHPVASVIGFLKGKSAIAIARMCGKERNFSGEHFWARGYAVSTAGFELEQVRKYIREQEVADGKFGQF